MARTTSFGYTDSIATPVNQPRIDLSYAADFLVQSESPTQVVLANRTSPLDQLEVITLQYRNVSDIYQSVPSIDPSAYAISRAGRTVTAIVQDVARTVDSGDPTFRQDLPVRATVSLAAPLNSDITNDQLLSVIMRAVSAWFNNLTVTSVRTGELVRGGMKPSGM